MEFEQVIQLIQAVSDSSLRTFDYQDGETKLSLKKEKVSQKVIHVSGTAAGKELQETISMETAELIQGGTLPEAKAIQGNGGFEHVVKSPLVGTFYSSSTPEAEPYVRVGDHVKKGQTLGIIEAMKLMNEIESDYDGIVEAILIENEQVVEFGQPLFRIK